LPPKNSKKIQKFRWKIWTPKIGYKNKQVPKRKTDQRVNDLCDKDNGLCLILFLLRHVYILHAGHCEISMGMPFNKRIDWIGVPCSPIILWSPVVQWITSFLLFQHGTGCWSDNVNGPITTYCAH
jgi:hypothetical protein